MRDFFGSVKFKVIACIMALLVGIMIYAGTTGGYSAATSQLFEMIFEPLKALSADISSKVTATFEVWSKAEEYRDENEKLRQELNEMYSRIVDYDEVKRENEDLRTMLGLKEKYENFEFSPPCKIISRTANDPYQSFTIDKGENDGIVPGDPVVTTNRRVGVCDEVSPATTRVRTLYSPNTALGAYTVPGRVEGIVQGGYEYGSIGRLTMNFVGLDEEICVDDVVVTSGSENFPAGMVIGAVESVETDGRGLSQTAVVKPVEDPATISGVFVITNYINEESGTGDNAQTAQ